MVPDHFRFGGGAAETAITPLFGLYLLIAVAIILTLPRKKVITPFLVAFFTIPQGQVLVLGGLHFTAVRVLILAVLARFARRYKYPLGFHPIDMVVILWTLATALVFWIQFPQAIVTGLGDLLDKLGGYLALRVLIADGEEMRRAIKAMVSVCVIQGVCMLGEQITGINAFGLLGAMPVAAAVRDGKIRAAGSLGALTAGPMAGVLIGMFLWLWTQRRSRTAAFVGIAAALIMVITSTSSTSYLAIGGSLLGLAVWPLRKQMRIIRWGLVCTLTGLHMVMKAPVWALIARIDLTGSSSGYQRYAIVDMTIRHFQDWWLVGNTDYVNWGWDSWDTCNQFVDVAFKGGLLSLILYIAIFKRSFAAIGNTRKLVNGNRSQEWTLWCLGTTLFSTIVGQFGINYAAVLSISFFTLVCCVCVATSEIRRTATPRLGQPTLESYPQSDAVLEEVR